MTHSAFKCRFFLANPAADEAQLHSLHGLLLDQLPNWSEGLSIGRYEGDRKSVSVGHSGSLARSFVDLGKQRLGTWKAVMKGSYEGITVFMSSNRSTLPPELNVISLEILGLTSIEGRDTQNWLRDFFHASLRKLTARYGYAWNSEEYEQKNIVTEESGTVKAVGAHLSLSLPGLYWLNYFGKPYVDLIGRERLLSCPCYSTAEVSKGVVVELSQDPNEWHLPDYLEREEACKRHLGQEYFFSKTDANKSTEAPRFR